MDIRYFVIFNAAGERQQTVVADGMPLGVADVLTKYPNAVEVSPADMLNVVNGWTMSANGQLTPPLVVLADVKAARIVEVERLARVAIAASDHELLEYYETKSLTDAEVGALKVKRQAIRNRRDALVQDIDSQLTVAKVNAVVVTFDDLI